ncbi:hypothetical protein K470DRAFT_3787 [Piedraia hortae CBS 480.64]|uniref:Uncharacterized protein n=1 Tax=Piedraia hortae CBS 480.64 TaxID=1314780 RepID=A0A6A7CAH5_9PEZI|nr:hypothetical protein K470DRAFT_3787 [Piedraia hortae CBS 480.64]
MLNSCLVTPSQRELVYISAQYCKVYLSVITCIALAFSERRCTFLIGGEVMPVSAGRLVPLYPMKIVFFTCASPSLTVLLGDLLPAEKTPKVAARQLPLHGAVIVLLLGFVLWATLVWTILARPPLFSLSSPQRTR